ELFRHEEIVDRDAFVHGVFLFPWGRLHFLKARAHDHVDLLTTQSSRGTAAIHCGIAATEHHNTFADLGVLGCFLATRDIEITTARRARSDEDCVPALGDQSLQTVNALAGAELNTEIEYIAALLVDDAVGQTEFRDLRADHAARFWITIEYHALIA